MSDILHASALHEAHPRLRVDLVRRALREDRIDPDVVVGELDEWIRLFRRDTQPGLRTLILVVLEGIEDPRLSELLLRARNDRGDGVRLEALRQLLERIPERRDELVEEALDDPGLEVQLLGAQALHETNPERAVTAILGICAHEAPGDRGPHALRRCSEILAEELADPRALPGLRELAGGIEDPEGHLAWAIETLENP